MEQQGSTVRQGRHNNEKRHEAGEREQSLEEGLRRSTWCAKCARLQEQCAEVAGIAAEQRSDAEAQAAWHAERGDEKTAQGRRANVAGG